MGEAIGQTLVFAAGIALSPLPIVAVILMLVTPRARTNGPAFLLGWLVGLAVVGAAALIVAGPLDAGGEEGPAAWIGVVELVLGAAFLVLGVRTWRGRPVEGEQTPPWMSALSGFTLPKSLGAGAAFGGVNPTNLLLALAAAAAITKAGLSRGEQAAAYAVFALVATIGVAIPVAIYFGLGDRATPLLGRMRESMTAHHAAIMTVLCLLLGMTLIGDAITALAS